MSVLLRSSIRPKNGRRREAKPSIREICLLTSEQGENAPGERLTRAGRSYRVEAVQTSSPAGAPGYVHLSCLDEG